MSQKAGQKRGGQPLSHFERENLIWGDPSLSPLETLLLLALNEFVDGNGQCYPGCNTLAEMCKTTPRTIKRLLRSLENRGLIHTLHRRTNKLENLSNLYTIKFSALRAETPKEGGVTQCHQGGDTVSLGGDTGSLPLVTQDHQGGDTVSPDLPIRSTQLDLLNDLPSDRASLLKSGEARENSLRSTEPEPPADPPAPPEPEPPTRTPVTRSAPEGDGPAHRSTGAGQNVPPPPAAPSFDPFLPRGRPHVVPIKAQFEGPWGRGYTPDLEAFEAWLLRHKASGKTNPSGWIAAVVDGIAKGGSRALWAEFKGQGSSGSGGGGDPKRAIAAELRRLNRPGILPPEWQQRTRCQSVSQLTDADAQAYLAELQSQGVSA